jgi:hypothetical protein
VSALKELATAADDPDPPLGQLADHFNESVRALHHLGVDCGVLWRGLQR